jgi:chromosome segregation ATPase
MAYQFYNIGKANARIAELEAELATAKAATPDQQLQARLDEALASNEDISNQLTAATAENTKLQKSVTELTEAKTSLGSELTAVTSALTLACTQMGVGTDEEVAKLSNADKVAALQKSVTKAVASIGVTPAAIPSASANAAPGAADKPKTYTERCLAANKAKAAQ